MSERAVAGKKASYTTIAVRGGRNRIGRREKWPKKSWELGGRNRGKSREEGEKEKLGELN